VIRIITAREHGRGEPPAEAEFAAAHRVDPAMNSVQLAAPHADGDRAAVQAACVELAHRDHVVLLGGEPDDREIGSIGDFRRLSLCNSHHDRIVARCA